MPVSIRKLAGRIGAVAGGADLTAPPDDPTLRSPVPLPRRVGDASRYTAVRAVAA
ncbi:hypothetical protein AB0D33_34380 [Streptomyces sp. NPDC048404]|uniref:hypothetical protein n=1 Tax=unclassified Streptomyces TaxID=2593676 RepID=UPI00341C84FD